jgi:hypothetical protein
MPLYLVSKEDSKSNWGIVSSFKKENSMLPRAKVYDLAVRTVGQWRKLYPDTTYMIVDNLDCVSKGTAPTPASQYEKEQQSAFGGSCW